MAGTSKIFVTDIVYSNIRKIIELTNGKVFPLYGLSLKTLAGFIAKSDIFISNDTGLMHLSTAVGTTVIGLYGPTDPEKWGPCGENNVVIKSKLFCSPCIYLGFEYKCRTRKCMESIIVNDVMSAVDDLICGSNYYKMT